MDGAVRRAGRAPRSGTIVAGLLHESACFGAWGCKYRLILYSRRVSLKVCAE